VQGQTGPSWQDGTDMWILTNTVVRFLGRVKTEREKISLVTMAALCFFIFAQCSDYRFLDAYSIICPWSSSVAQSLRVRCNSVGGCFICLETSPCRLVMSTTTNFPFSGRG
jgi:hypothetical protein